ncbi:M15 family metallopeptidase [Rubidibacter lacunae]|uniref:M15 family metallopeptidase n=1 Tax=Rubidibacter lacunae TaxID=582514 RepID=UPI00058DAABA|nr:M15 family metallopeptidase [Rubidibacter lacunae]
MPESIAIRECGESLVPIPADRFALTQPHAYGSLGAPYGNRSPYCIRTGVLKRLIAAQSYLQQDAPGWTLQIFDAYRPIAVQRFMVDHAFAELARAQGRDPDALRADPESAAAIAIWQQVFEFWAPPSSNPATPPPHSTGAALDVTLLDATGAPAAMGSPIDECSPRSYPDHFRDCPELPYHAHRQLLAGAMRAAGFVRHPREWWHFSWGDRLWAQLSGTAIAHYGSI